MFKEGYSRAIFTRKIAIADVLEAMESCTATRYFNETPVSRKDLAKLV